MLYQTENPHGGNIYANDIRLDFSASINPLGTPPVVLEAVKSSLRRIDCYPDPACSKLIEAIAAYENIPSETILCGNGAAELIYSFCFSEKPGRALIPVPTFSEYETALLPTGCEIIHHQMKFAQDFILDESILDGIAIQRPDVVFLCNPGNPTGRLISPYILKEIIALCEINNIRMFVDECFLDLTGSDRSLTSYLPGHSCLFILKSLTKTFALPGIRIGYGLSSDKALLKRMSQTVQPWNVSLIAQEAGVAALKEAEYLEKSIDLIASEREWLTEKIKSFGFSVCLSDANYILFNAASGLDKQLRKAGIAIRSCSNFIGLGPGWYRIAVRSHNENQQLICAINETTEHGSPASSKEQI